MKLKEQLTFLDLAELIISKVNKNEISYKLIKIYVSETDSSYTYEDLLTYTITALVHLFNKTINFDCKLESEVDKKIYNLYKTGNLENIL